MGEFQTDTEQSIANDILSDIDTGEGASNEQSSEQTTQTPEGGTAAPVQPSQTQQADSGHSQSSGQEQTPQGQQQAGTPDPQGQQQQQQQQQQPGQQQEQEPQEAAFGDDRGYLKVDPKGNLVNEQGRIVARAGKERRYYEGYRKNEKLYREAADANKQYEAALKATEVLNGLPKQLGLEMSDVDIGLKIVSNWKQDPVGTAKYILTELAAQGHDLAQVFDGQAVTGINTGAVQRMIDERLAPITSDHKAKQDEQKLTDEAQQATDDFFSNYPDARTHQGAIANLMQQSGSPDPEKAYLKLKAWAAEQGLDWSKPLRPQLEAKSNQQQTNPQQAPLPSGGNQQPGVAAPMSSHNTAGQNTSDSYADIVKASMQDVGLPIN